jgi:hypothetical protein
VKYFPVNETEASLKKGLALIPHLTMDNFGFSYYSESQLTMSIHSELGVLQLTRGDFLESCDTLVRNGHEADALYLMERVLNLEELKNHVDRNFPANPEKALKKGEQESDSLRQKRIWVRGVLARRLNRNFRFAEASAYFIDEPRTLLNQFVEHWNAGWDSERPDQERADGYWKAAELVNNHGDKIFGSELEPYWRLWGEFHNFNHGPLTRPTNDNFKIAGAGKEEIQRVAENAPAKSGRFNCRYFAADLAWNASLFMPNQSDETALRLHTAGSWIKYLDHQAADRFYKSLVRRCRKTSLGEAADLKRWFLRTNAEGNFIYPKPKIMGDMPKESTEVTTGIPLEPVL